MKSHSHLAPLPSFNLTFPSHRRRFLAGSAPRKLSSPLLSLPPLSRAPNPPFSNPLDDLLPSPANDSELELLDKPSPLPPSDDTEDPPREPPDLDEALAPFLKLFGSGYSSDDADSGEQRGRIAASPGVRCYEPKPGDLVVGVVVSGNENRMDVNVGADFLGTMLTKEVLPLYGGEMPHVLCDLENGGEFGVPGKIGVVMEEEAFGGEPGSGRPVVDVGTVLFAEVLGRTLSGRPLLSTRRMFRRVAWHRVRQIKQLNEPIEVRIFEWNTGGLLTRIEGLRAFLPKAELMNRINNFTELKENVGRQISVCISRIDEETNELIISEKEAWVSWDMLYLKEGTLLEGTVRKIFPYGAQVRIGETNRSGLLHISNLSRSRITSVSDLLKIDEKVKVLVVKSMFPEKISLSIADLESEPGLFLSDKEKVFSEAEEMARRYRRRLPTVSATNKLDNLPVNALPFDDESRFYANWKWFKFERHEDENPNGSILS